MLFVELDCGRRVWVDRFSCTLTYAGLILGRPNPKLNERILASAMNERPESEDNPAIHLIPPKVDLSDPEHPVLPPILLRAWLTCYEPLNPEFILSALEVVWLTEECHHETIEDILTRGLQGLSWETLARDFD